MASNVCVLNTDREGAVLMTDRRVFAAWLALLSFAVPQAATAEEQPAGAELTLAAPHERDLGDYPGHPSHTFLERTAGFRFGPVAYAIAYKACIDKAHGGKVAPLEGYIGMPVPTACNWYHSGFLFVSLNGQELGTTPLSSMLVAQRGERAILDLVWRHEVANVRVRFVGLPGSDHLDCEIALEPKQEITSVAAGLRCYPSFFTSHYKRAGARRIQTPGALVEEGNKATLEAGANWWGLYYTREGWEHTEVPVRLRLRLGEYPLSYVCCTPAGEVPRTSTSVCS
ncbi:MAG: hypothetical protein COY42_07850 [Armatimonadetes bacterium CG_4_10_14_0_8_um_filter_66_14]|nr:hypothetical protein [Armatimonadota bacterium]OIP04223.1 MAG: hypothetical protein AUJ96_13385 [Armatimonadetes bacterium CG2_30_66_41]PIU91862.1 MAG: hypothetical protein COS65_20555 [Armatimonadetes bacterium CG06_land_8_20_14_3_00_66_21]PIZ47753.1 MAG: hypothetical protein COY42_07850 [Armatimonadetes bacterium CG_4_10_14_0_8_um_filter_66_14]NCO93872.1 hypothetical protein [Armatimonadota bacterium]